MCATRFFRISAANIAPNRFHQNRTVSWLMSIPRSARRSSTLRNDSGYFTYIITTRRITSGELLKYRNGCSSPEATTAKRRPEKFVDTRFGFFVNHDLACYEVPVHADISHQDVLFLEEADDKANPMKAKGVGELGLCGVGAAVANAIYNATGMRVRDYPITLDKHLEHLPTIA